MSDNDFISSDLLKDWVIVVVDDEPDSLEVARFILDFYGAKVHTASDGTAGFNLITRVRPRFVISDLSMPMTDGWSLLEKLKQEPGTKDIPVIALTAHAMRGDRERAIAAGFYNYLTKPLTASKFIGNLLTLLMEIPQLAAELRR